MFVRVRNHQYLEECVTKSLMLTKTELKTFQFKMSYYFKYSI